MPMTTASRSVAEARLLEIFAHLDCAVTQSIPSDDQIIIEHIRKARDEAVKALAECRQLVEPANA